jgi:Zn-dependent M28 family amino/carboxypeptidase
VRVLLFISLLTAGAVLHAQTLTWNQVSGETLTKRVSAAPLKNEDRGTRLEELFKEAGCRGDLLQRRRVNNKWDNITCTLAGATDEVIVIGAHYDHVHLGDGAVDNWSGTSLLPSLYQTLAASDRHFSYVFVGFAEEEKGLYGSRAFVKELGKDKTPKVKAMVNIDSIGMTPPKVWVSRSDERLLQIVAAVGAAIKISVAGVNVENVGDSDSRPFAEKKIPVLDVHSLTTETLPVLHSKKDKLSAIVAEHYEETYRLLAATLVYLDQKFRP